MAKDKLTVQLTLSDLRSLGVLPPKNQKKKTKRRRKNKKLNQLQSNNTIGGIKSDNSGLVGFGSYTPFTNTANVNSQIQLANLKAIEDGTFNRFPAQNTSRLDEGVIDRSFSKLMLPYIEQNQQDVDRIKGVLNRGIADYYDFKEQYQNERPRILDLYDVDDNAGITNPTLGSDQFVNGGIDLDEAPAQNTRMDEPVKPQYNTSNEIDEERFNPALPMDDEPLVTIRGKSKTMKSKDRKTLFGAPKQYAESDDRAEPEQEPQLNEQETKARKSMYDLMVSSRFIPKLSSGSKIAPVIEPLPDARMSTPIASTPINQSANPGKATKTPEEVRQTEQLIANNTTQRVPKGMTAKKAIALYHHYGGKDEFVSSMNQPGAILKQFKQLPKYQEEQRKKKEIYDLNI